MVCLPKKGDFMAKVYYDKDADLSWLDDKTVAVLGYGSQGKAHALNLKDSGVDVIVGLRRSSKNWNIAEKDGMDVKEIKDAVKNADVIAFLIPDMVQPDVYNNDVKDNMKDVRGV